ncbi:hypothetical protein FRB93_006802 [Tulasnella sp. JGI-2019a]|nr:hypothetical protein FRB93_006802 [Tulasnella sp. JGI-2019a]
MDPTAVNTNVTIDDWDSILNYANPADWQTPDPQSPPLATVLPTTPWLDGTYHQTGVVNASITLDFQGPAIYVFGASGPTYGSYAVSIDGVETTYSAYATSNATTPHLLYGNGALAYSSHTLQLRNLGAAQASDQGASAFLLDFILATVQLGPAGATITNTTVEDNDPKLKYSGTWTEESGPLFRTALYIFGDTVNNHGEYSVTIDNHQPQTYNSIRGCGGAFGKFCEKTQPSLRYFAGNLDSSEHTVTVTNIAINSTFIGRTGLATLALSSFYLTLWL